MTGSTGTYKLEVLLTHKMYGYTCRSTCMCAFDVEKGQVGGELWL